MPIYLYNETMEAKERVMHDHAAPVAQYPGAIDTIQKERRVMPLWLVVEGPKVPDCDIHTPLDRCLVLECRRLTGTRFGDPHLRRGFGVVAQLRRPLFPVACCRTFVDYRACPRGDICSSCVHSTARITGLPRFGPHRPGVAWGGVETHHAAGQCS